MGVTREPNATGRVAIPASVFAGPVTLAPDGLYLFLPRERFSVEEHRPAFAEIVLPASDLKRLFPHEPGEWPDLAAGAPGLPRTARKAEAPTSEQHRNPELVARTGSPGRPPSSKDLYTREHGGGSNRARPSPTCREKPHTCETCGFRQHGPALPCPR